jgi:hypothetical protein
VEQQESLDADLMARVFRLLKVVEFRQSQQVIASLNIFD